MARETGEQFFKGLTANLAAGLGTDYAFLAVIDPAEADRIAVLSAFGPGAVVENLGYHIKDTPCERVLREGPSIYAKGVREQFPEDYLLQHMQVESFAGTWLLDRAGRPMGLLAVMHTAPLAEPRLADAMLRISALRASAEIERARADEALRSSEEKLSKVYSTSPDAITLSSLAESRYLDVNEGFTRMFGYDRTEVIGRAALDIGLWRMPAQRGDLVASLGAHGGVRNMEAELVTRDGAVRTCLISADIIEVDGRACILAVTRDISERKAAEVALRASERRYRALFEESQALHFVVDREGRLLDVNDAVLRAYEIDRDALIGRSALNFVHDEDRPAVAAAVETLFSGGSACPCHVQVVVGENVRTLMLAFGGLDDSGEHATVLVNALDVTEWHRSKQERARLEEEVQQAQKMEAIGRLAGGIAHDFNNILLLIHGHLGLALEHVPVDSHPASAINAALKTVTRACGLTRQLLTFSRRDPVRVGALCLASEVADLASLMRGVIGDHITLEVTTEEALPTVRIDRTQLEQIILNLSINARDAMPAGGRIVIDTRRVDISAEACSTRPAFREGAFVCLSVSDSGAGIPQEVQPHIFEPFFTTKETDRGTGLGLATVYGIVQRCGGFVDVISAIGEGTTMRVFLPVANARSESDTHTAGRGEAAPRTDAILVVEADRTVRDLVCAALERAGYRVLPTANASEGVTLFEAHADDIALVVLDAGMSKTQGQMLFERVKRDRPSLPILFSSGYAEHPLEDEDDLSSRPPVIRKPYLPSALVRRVRDLIERGGDTIDGALTDDPRR